MKITRIGPAVELTEKKWHELGCHICQVCAKPLYVGDQVQFFSEETFSQVENEDGLVEPCRKIDVKMGHTGCVVVGG